jgi:YegS/Rv2252/BmrU family lipid kinase
MTGTRPDTEAVRRALIVANPIAGSGRARQQAERLTEGLSGVGIDAELHLTSARGDGHARVRREVEEGRADLIVSVGGDGTLGEVISGLDGASVRVASLPMGTANALALDLALPRSVEGLLELIQNGTTSEVDVALVNGRVSFLVVGVGFDAALVRDLDQNRKGPITRMTYVHRGLRALRHYQIPRRHVTIDDTPLAGTYGLVLVSNVIHYAGLRCMAPDRLLNDGLFEAYLFREAGRASLLAQALRGLTTGFPGGPVERVQGRRFRIESAEPVPYQVDGDYGGETPVEIEVTSRPFRMFAP